MKKILVKGASGFQGNHICAGFIGEKTDKERNVMERLFYSYLGEYNPYLSDGRTFDILHAKPLLQTSNIHCPKLNYPVFTRLMLRTDY
jgi:hypothetical protein